MQENQERDVFSPSRGRHITRAKIERARELRKEMTPEEKILWEYIRKGRLHGLHFRRQQVIAGFIADFYCHAANLVIEVDGGIHVTQCEYDDERDTVFAGYGLCVLRVTNDQIHQNIQQIIARIHEIAHRAGAI